MARPEPFAPFLRRRGAFTLVEVLTATALSLLLMVAVVRVFATVSGSISDSRSALEMGDRLRLTASRLQRDLAGVTVTMLPPRRPEDNEGYFEYVEGPMVGPTGEKPQSYDTTENYYVKPVDALNNDASGNPVRDYTVTDTDDILMFTTRDENQPFVGKYGNSTITSPVAEVAWFMRGNTLYRRVLVVQPSVNVSAGFSYQNADLSVGGNATFPFANSLGDLTKRENRFAHDANNAPYSTRGWKQLGLPILWEAGAVSPGQLPTAPSAVPQADFWTGAQLAPTPYSQSYGGTLPDDPNVTTPRANEDVILTHVIGFDVKAWDPGAPLEKVNAGAGEVARAPGDLGYSTGNALSNLAGYGAYVNLGYDEYLFQATGGMNPTLGQPSPSFNRRNNDISGGPGSGLYRTYCTWSTHYENGGIAGIPNSGNGTDGFDNNGNGLVDELAEQTGRPPYPCPLRGIQIKIRTFDPDSRQIRETTVVQDFLVE